MSRQRFFMLVWRPSWISVHCIALMFFVIILFEFLIPKNLGVDTKINLPGAFLWKLWSIMEFSTCAWWPFWIFAFCDFRSNFLKVYPGYFDSHMTPVHKCKVKVSAYFIVYGVLWQSQEYTMYCGKNNEHLITSNGRTKYLFFYKNLTINKFCHKNERVLFSRYQYTANAPVLSDIDGSGPREKAYIL